MVVNNCLQRLPKDIGENCKPEIAYEIAKKFYVDDYLSSFSSDEKALEIIRELKNTLALGGFSLRKWISNSPLVMSEFDSDELEIPSMDLDLSDDVSSRTLGCLWNVKEDTIFFNINITDPSPTRRNLLSNIHKVFDPLSIVAPIMIPIKRLIQSHCQINLGWDDNIPELDVWEKWLEMVPELRNFSIPRCYKPIGFGNAVNVQIHAFADASQTAYASNVFLRLTNDKGEISVRFVAGKARVCPLSPANQSIPRLELTASAQCAKLVATVVNELDMEIHQRFYWSDSEAVLACLARTDRRFQTFWANQLGIIHQLSDVKDWRHVPSELNAADPGSRGIFPN